MTGEKIYEYDLDITGLTDYGVTLPAILSGQVRVPPQGARIDVAFAGRATGRLSGRVTGVDYLRIRSDGRIDLEIRATIETEDGHRIALSADGAGVPRAAEPVADLRENVSLTTAAETYAWVNTRQVWGVGTVNLAAGKVHIDATCSERRSLRGASETGICSPWQRLAGVVARHYPQARAGVRRVWPSSSRRDSSSGCSAGSRLTSPLTAAPPAPGRPA